LQHGFALLDPKSEKIKMLEPVEDIASNRFNDGKCDPQGRFWAGTMAISLDNNCGSLYRMNFNGSVEKVLNPVSISNGLVWSLDHKWMYYIDTPTRTVEAFHYEPITGHIKHSHTAVTFLEGEGLPDGMTQDADGNLWICHWNGGRVSRWNPLTGKKLFEVMMPAARVTSCAFGGENLDELYVTTARKELSERDLREQPNAGGLFRVRPGVRGLIADECKNSW